MDHVARVAGVAAGPGRGLARYLKVTARPSGFPPEVQLSSKDELMDQWLTPGAHDAVGAVGVCLVAAFSIMRGHLIPGKTHREALAAVESRVAEAESRANRWEGVALKALDATERLTEPVAISARVLERLPNPSEDDVT